MQKITKISFPGLGIGEFGLNNEAFSIFGIGIAWYAIIITLGMVFAVCYTIYRAKQINIDYEEILDFAIFVIPIGVLGARLYYVLMELDSFNSFKEVFNIRNGGLAIYGGIIAGALTVFAVCKYKKINFFAFADCVVPGLIMAQSIGRWGNFVNVEAYGGLTKAPWRMCSSKIAWELLNNTRNPITAEQYEAVINGTLGAHPTFLYESLWNLIGFVLINIFYKHKKYDGQIFFMIFGWYGLGRAWIEGLRTDSLWFNLFGLQLRTSQVLAIIIFIVCAAFIIYFAIKPPKKELYVRKNEKKKA